MLTSRVSSIAFIARDVSISFGVVDVSLSAVMLVGLGAVLISLDWRLGLVMVIPVPVICAAIFVHGRRMNQLFTRVISEPVFFLE